MASNTDSPRECLIRFEPDGVETRVPKGTSILDAAQSCGVLIDSVCGGTGRCGRCKVRVRGEFSLEPGSKSASQHAEDHVVLACLANADGDLEVFVPKYSRIGVHQILEASEHVELKQLSPFVRKEYLELPAPTLEDNLGDFERLKRALQLTREDSPLISLDILRKLPKALREKDWEVTATLSEEPFGKALISIQPGDTRKRAFGICVDIGTTTVVLSLVNLNTGETVATESTYNKQIIHGEDILSRITYAEEEGTEKLTKLVIETINSLVSEALANASERAGEALSPEDIISAAISGNTTMIHLFLMLDAWNIRREPYIPVSNAPQNVNAGEIGLNVNPHCPVFISPGRSGYVGGDVLSDILASGMHLSKKLTLLIDVGTNGEIALGCKDWMVCCSCSAGPAFEGGEVSSGMRAMRGAIDRIQITKSGEANYHTIGEADPLGICGSGLVDLLSGLFMHDFIDRQGNLHEEESERIRKGPDGELEFFVAERGKGEAAKGWAKEKRGEIVINELDIQNIIRTKAAIYSGCSVLLKSMDHDISGISQIVIAGGFGQFLDVPKAISIGLIPDVKIEKYRFIGNGSLEGARLALLSHKKRTELFDIYRNLTYFELSVSGLFFDEFTSALFLPHTDIELFPTVKSIITNNDMDID